MPLASQTPYSPVPLSLITLAARRWAAALHGKRRMELGAVGLVRVLADARDGHATRPEQRIVDGGYAVGWLEVRLGIVRPVAETSPVHGLPVPTLNSVDARRSTAPSLY